MNYKVKRIVEEKYLPKGCRKERVRYIEKYFEVAIKELHSEEFPVAMITTNGCWDYITMDGDGAWNPKFETEYRAADGKLFKAVQMNRYVSHGKGYLMADNYDEVDRFILRDGYGYQGSPEFVDGKPYDEKTCKIVSSNQEIKLSRLKMAAAQCLIYEGKIWKKCGEPMYCINTFGLGHNHGGTGIFIDEHYNENIPNTNYFSALERDKALQYADKVAAGRGDTDSVGTFDGRCNIQVLLPEMVKRNPMKDHGTGDDFVNGLERIINASDSSIEAGLLVMASALKA